MGIVSIYALYYRKIIQFQFERQIRWSNFEWLSNLCLSNWCCCHLCKLGIRLQREYREPALSDPWDVILQVAPVQRIFGTAPKWMKKSSQYDGIDRSTVCIKDTHKVSVICNRLPVLMWTRWQLLAVNRWSKNAWPCQALLFPMRENLKGPCTYCLKYN